jgi:hypothetical protein
VPERRLALAVLIAPDVPAPARFNVADEDLIGSFRHCSSRSTKSILAAEVDPCPSQHTYPTGQGKQRKILREETATCPDIVRCRPVDAGLIA